MNFFKRYLVVLTFIVIAFWVKPSGLEPSNIEVILREQCKKILNKIGFEDTNGCKIKYNIPTEKIRPNVEEKNTEGFVNNLLKKIWPNVEEKNTEALKLREILTEQKKLLNEQKAKKSELLKLIEKIRPNLEEKNTEEYKILHREYLNLDAEIDRMNKIESTTENAIIEGYLLKYDKQEEILIIVTKQLNEIESIIQNTIFEEEKKQIWPKIKEKIITEGIITELIEKIRPKIEGKNTKDSIRTIKTELLELIGNKCQETEKQNIKENKTQIDELLKILRQVYSIIAITDYERATITDEIEMVILKENINEQSDALEELLTNFMRSVPNDVLSTSDKEKPMKGFLLRFGYAFKVLCKTEKVNPVNSFCKKHIKFSGKMKFFIYNMVFCSGNITKSIRFDKNEC